MWPGTVFRLPLPAPSQTPTEQDTDAFDDLHNDVDPHDACDDSQNYFDHDDDEVT